MSLSAHQATAEVAGLPPRRVDPAARTTPAAPDGPTAGWRRGSGCPRPAPARRASATRRSSRCPTPWRRSRLKPSSVSRIRLGELVADLAVDDRRGLRLSRCCLRSAAADRSGAAGGCRTARRRTPAGGFTRDAAGDDAVERAGHEVLARRARPRKRARENERSTSIAIQGFG